MAVAAATAYVHIRHPAPTHPVTASERIEASAIPTPGPDKGIVVAPFAGGSVGSRWQSSGAGSTPPSN